MSYPTLQAEFERLFELDEMLHLSRELLGLTPQLIGGENAKGSYAAALTRYCAEHGALEALCDAILATKPGSSTRLLAVAQGRAELHSSLGEGQHLGALLLGRRLGQSSAGDVFLAKDGTQDVRLKALRPAATRDSVGVQRLLTLHRVLGSLKEPGLPRLVGVEKLLGHVCLVHRIAEGQTLADALARRPFSLGQAINVLRAVAYPLGALHERGLSHGNLKLQNVLLFGDERQPQALLLDAGLDRLIGVGHYVNGKVEERTFTHSASTTAPEQIRGVVSDVRSDVYALGAIFFELLTGEALFRSATAFGALLGHLEQTPPSPSAKLKAVAVAQQVDELVARLLAKDPDLRPSSAAEVLEALDSLDRARSRRSIITADQLAVRIQALLENPSDRDLALALESTLEDGAEAARIAAAFDQAAHALLGQGQHGARDAARGLLFRAARLYEHGERELAKAELSYKQLLLLDPADEAAAEALRAVLKQQGKHEEVLEGLLERVEAEQSSSERARLFVEMATIYQNDLRDREQALVAYTQAYTEAPEHPRLATHIEELVGDDVHLYEEVLGSMAEAVAREGVPEESRVRILVQAGSWYSDKVKADDLAHGCFQSALALEPANHRALLGIARIFRRAKQWPELTQVLTHLADRAATPEERRNLLAECAEVYEVELSEPQPARALYESVLAEDPGHALASRALLRLAEQAGDAGRMVELLSGLKSTQPKDERLRTCLRLAELYEDSLHDDEKAISALHEALSLDSAHTEALRGLDRVFTRTGRFQDLILNLKSQLAIAVTPRQKITLLERLAGVYDEEFLDHQQAAQAWEQVLALDTSHEEALTALVRHYRALEDWPALAAIYERQAAIASEPAVQVSKLVALGRVQAQELANPEAAMATYERVLALDPQNSSALEALAKLRETTGDADAALRALLALADKAADPKAAAEQLMRAARLMETRHDLDGRILYLRQALDKVPDYEPAVTALSQAYLERGDARAMATLLERQIELCQSEAARVDLCGELAHAKYTYLGEPEEAERLAKRAVVIQKDHLRGQVVLGHVAFDAERHLEAVAHYRTIAMRADRLPKDEAITVLTRYVQALAKVDAADEATQAIDILRRLAPDDANVLWQAAKTASQHGDPTKAIQIFEDLFKRFSLSLSQAELGEGYLHYGIALNKLGRHEEAIGALERAEELEHEGPEAFDAWAGALEKLERWEESLKIRARQLDLVSGDARVDLLTHIGEIAATKLGDRDRATSLLVTALEERPDDRRLLTKLMQLYSEAKDWQKLIDVVVRLAGFVEDPKQKAKYLQTAAVVAHKELGDTKLALQTYEQALLLDPTLERAEQEVLSLHRSAGNHEKVERLLKRKFKHLSETGDEGAMLATLLELGRLYEQELKDSSKAIDAYEAARTLDPDNRSLLLRLAELYSTDLDRYFDKARQCHAALLREDPFNKDGYKALCRLYTRAKHADGTWCTCQALTVLNLADADEERFFLRMRSETALAAQRALGDTDWLDLMHPKADPLLTSLFALIEPAVIARRGSSLAELGYDPTQALDLANHPASLSQNLAYAASVLGIPAPPTFANPAEPGGMLFLHAHRAAIVLGAAALGADLPPQPAAFLAARHLTFFRPGLYLRHLVPTGTGLKAWLFGALRLIAPQFPVSPELEGAASEAQAALDATLRGPARDQLARVVNRLLQTDASLDLRSWVAGVDLTADRIGFIISDDLRTAAEVIRASDESVSSIPASERLRELLLFSVDELYLKTRFDLGVAIET